MSFASDMFRSNSVYSASSRIWASRNVRNVTIPRVNAVDVDVKKDGTKILPEKNINKC